MSGTDLYGFNDIYFGEINRYFTAFIAVLKAYLYPISESCIGILAILFYV